MRKKLLQDKKVFILDMDGTFYLGDRLLEGSLEFIDTLRDKGIDFLFFTNNTSKAPQFYLDKLVSMGCDIDKNQLATSGMVTIDYLLDRFNNPRVYLLGTPLLEDDFKANGLFLTDDRPDAVVVGFDTTLTYEKLNKACDLIRGGVPFLATHPDKNCPLEGGGLMPDCGAMCAFITASTEKEPKYLGKPSFETIDYVIRRTGASKKELVFVGDRLETDIAIGSKHGVTTALVLTGVTRQKDLASSDVNPDIVADRLVDLTYYL
ncbi:MAG TPA: HAD-IIA family hydrolase [Bacillota bacterium]|nr:HAD-IIA family hydrolase [Bacillota bacterium]